MRHMQVTYAHFMALIVLRVTRLLMIKTIESVW